MKKTWVSIFVGVMCISFLGAIQFRGFTASEVQYAVQFDDEKSFQSIWDILSGEWKIVQEDDNGVLTQTVQYLDFPKVLFTTKNYYDFEVSVKVRIQPLKNEKVPLEGESIYETRDFRKPEIIHPIDYAGGLLLRYRGPFLFYAVFLDARRKQVALFYMNRIFPKLVKKISYPVELNQWYTLEVKCVADRIQVSVDGRVLIVQEERRLGSGRTGLITVGGSKVLFDDYRLKTEELNPIQDE